VNDSVITEIIGTTAWVRLNRPNAANAINNQMRAELSGAFDIIDQNANICAVVITGVGKAFAAGSDVSELRGLTAIESIALSNRIAAFHRRLSQSEKPIIAAINGWCLGGGFELALACDIRIASTMARFGLPEATLGIVSGGGGIPRLVRLAGPGVARQMCLTAEIIGARAAIRHGLVTRIVSPARLEAEARQIAERIASLGSISLAQCKRVLAAAEDADLKTAEVLEAQACGICFSTDDQSEGMQAFIEKRPPKFAGR